MPKIEDKKSVSVFSKQTSKQFIPDIFNNSHLPNLRGRFIQEKFYEAYDGLCKKPIILEGSVTLRQAMDDRNAMLLLYVSGNFSK